MKPWTEEEVRVRRAEDGTMVRSEGGRESRKEREVSFSPQASHQQHGAAILTSSSLKKSWFDLVEKLGAKVDVVRGKLSLKGRAH